MAVLLAQGVLMVPLYLQFLGATLYGFWLATGGIVSWLMVVDFGAAAVTTQRTAAASSRGDRQGIADYFVAGAVMTAGVSAILGLVILVSSAAIIRWIGVEPQYVPEMHGCLLLVGGGGVCWIWNCFFRGFLAGIQQNAVAVISGVFGEIVALGFIIGGLFSGWGIWALAVASLLRSVIPMLVVSTVSVSTVVRMRARLRFSHDILLDYLKSTPSILTAKATGQFAVQLPTVLITLRLGPEQAVLYSVTIRAAQLLEQAVGGPMSTLVGGVGHYLHDATVTSDRKRALLYRVARVFVAILVVFTLMYSAANESFVSLWVGDSQFGGHLLTGATALATAAILCARFCETLLLAVGDISGAGLIGTAERIVRICGILVATSVIGVSGPMIAVAAVLILALPVYLWRLRRKSAELASAARVLAWGWLPASVGVTLGFIANRALNVTDWVDWIVGNLVLLVACSLVIFVSNDEVRRLVLDVRSGLRKRFAGGG